MLDSRKRVRQIIGITAGIWIISLLVFLLYSRIKVNTGTGAIAFYGLWNIFVFSASYWKILKTVNTVLCDMNDSIQSLIDGKPRQHFKEEEESIPGKFQMQLMKLYRIMDASKEKEQKMRGEMSGMVADMVHQVNTPITNIQMYSQFLAQDELTQEEKVQMSEVINTQVEKLGWFAEGFAKAARLETGIMQLYPKPQPILPIVTGAIDQVSLKARKRGNEIILEGNQDICAVYDRRWTEEAVFNILDNAVKYGKEGMPITVEMTAYSLFVRIDVRNWGTLIPKEEYSRIFTRFYRGSSAAMIEEGAGLGLYLTRKILTEQGGYVKAGAYGKKGNEFSLFLRKA